MAMASANATPKPSRRRKAEEVGERQESNHVALVAAEAGEDDAVSETQIARHRAQARFEGTAPHYDEPHVRLRWSDQARRPEQRVDALVVHQPAHAGNDRLGSAQAQVTSQRGDVALRRLESL